jgi:hypothetical protein
VRQVTVEYRLGSNITLLATNTVIGSAAIATLGTKTIQVPNLVAGGVISARVVVSWQDAFTAAVNVTTQRVGISVNGGAYNNLDFAYTAIGNTGDHEANFITRDITSLLSAVAAPTFTLACQFAMATSANSNINNIHAKLILTYEFDETAVVTSFVQTIRIPIQGDITTIPTAGTYQQIGTTGTGSAPVNQIPQLTGVGGILTGYGATLVIDDQWMEVAAQQGGSGTGDFTGTYRFDGAGATYARATQEQQLDGSTFFFDMFDMVAPALSTTAAHSWEMTTSLNARFSNTCAVYYLTIRWDPTQSDYTRHLNSIKLPLPMEDLDTYISSTATGSRDAISKTVWIEEPGSITLRQSGFWLVVAAGGGATLNLAAAQGNTMRPHTLGSLVISGPFFLCRRGDFGTTPWTVARGQNTFSMGMFTTGASTAVPEGGWIYLNYESDVRTVGGTKRPWDHNHTLFFNIQNAPTSGALPTRRDITTGFQTPEIATPWFLNSWAVEQMGRISSGLWTNGIKLQVTAGEGLGAGWATRQAPTINDAEVQFFNYIADFTEFGRQNSNRSDGLNPNTSRTFQTTGTTASASSYGQWITANHLTYDVDVTSVDYTGDGSGIPVQVISTQTERVEGEGTTVIGGSVTITVFDNAYTHFATAQQSPTSVARSEDDTPSLP